MAHQAGTAGQGHKFTLETDQAACRNVVFQTGTTVTVAFHIGQFATAAAEFFHDRALVFIWHIHSQIFVRLAFLTVNFTEYHARFADCQFKAFAAHVFQQNGQVQFATTGNAEYISVGSIFNTQGNVGQQFFLQAVADLAGSHEFAFSTGQRRSVDHKVHGQGRLVHAQHRQAFRIVFVGNGYADADVFDTGNNHDVAGFSFFQRYAFQALETQQLVDTALGNLFFMVHNGNDLAGFDAAVQDATDTESAGVVVVVQLGNLQLQRFFRAAAWCRRVFQNGLEQRTHIAALVVFIQFGKAGQTGSIDDREVQLFVSCTQVVE